MKLVRVITQQQSIDLADLPGEEWIDVFGYDGIYQASNMGRVKALPREVRCGDHSRVTRLRIMRQGWNALHGNWHVVFCVDLVRRTMKVSRVVWEAFNGGPPPLGHEVMHRDKVQTNDRLSNLEAVTHRESCERNYVMGVSVFAENLPALNAARMAELDALLVASPSARICRTCKRELPNAEFIRTDTTYLHRRCRDCRLKQKGVREVGKQRTADELYASGLRRCNLCATVKPLTEFGLSKASPGGYNHKCLPCARQYNRARAKIQQSCPTPASSTSPT